MIVKHAQPRKWTVVDRDTINDKRLSLRARGLIVWLLDKPTDWQWTSDSVAKETTEGRDAIRAAARELEVLGYIDRRKIQLDDGRWVTETWVYERPEDASLPETDSQAPVLLPETANQSSENRASVSQALSSTELKPSTRALGVEEQAPAMGRDSLAARLFEGLKRQNPRVRLHECAEVIEEARRANKADAVIDEAIGRAIAAEARWPSYIAEGLELPEHKKPGRAA